MAQGLGNGWEKSEAGGRRLCQYVPGGQGGPAGSKGYYKVQTLGEKEWQQFDLDGKPSSAADFHGIPMPSLTLPIFVIPKVFFDYGLMPPDYQVPDA